jgi:hypothetical protein
MDQPFAHPTGERLLSEVRTIFENKPIFHRRDKPFVFVCGGSTKRRSRTIRRKFLEWAEHGVPNVVSVLAEDAYDYTHLYDPPEVVNLSDFEGFIGEIRSVEPELIERLRLKFYKKFGVDAIAPLITA